MRTKKEVHKLSQFYVDQASVELGDRPVSASGALRLKARITTTADYAPHIANAPQSSLIRIIENQG